MHVITIFLLNTLNLVFLTFSVIYQQYYIVIDLSVHLDIGKKHDFQHQLKTKIKILLEIVLQFLFKSTYLKIWWNKNHPTNMFFFVLFYLSPLKTKKNVAFEWIAVWICSYILIRIIMISICYINKKHTKGLCIINELPSISFKS